MIYVGYGYSPLSESSHFIACFYERSTLVCDSLSHKNKILLEFLLTYQSVHKNTLLLESRGSLYLLSFWEFGIFVVARQRVLT